MKLPSLLIFLCVILSACTNLIKLTPNEDRGVKDVLDTYAGYCKYSIGESASTQDGTKKFFELELSKSDVVQKFSTMPDVVASGIAYTFYDNLKDESKNYNEVHSVLIFSNNKKIEYSYSTDSLALIASKMKIVDRIINLIHAKNFNELKPLLSDEAYADSDKNNLISNIKRLDPAFGTFKSFIVLGFRFETINNFNVVHVLGIMTRNKQNNRFSVKINLKSSEDKVMYMDYDF